MYAAPMHVVAVLPKKPGADPLKEQLRIKAALTEFAFEAQRDMQKYPAWQPWTSRPPSSGPRKGGRRTGTYGRTWRVSWRGKYTVEIGNNTAYARFVGGPKGTQTRVMAGRGWPSISTVGPAAMKRAGIKVGFRVR